MHENVTFRIGTAELVAGPFLSAAIRAHAKLVSALNSLETNPRDLELSFPSARGNVYLVVKTGPMMSVEAQISVGNDLAIYDWCGGDATETFLSRSKLVEEGWVGHATVRAGEITSLPRHMQHLAERPLDEGTEQDGYRIYTAWLRYMDAGNDRAARLAYPALFA